ncbi:hypothetical protein D9M71_282830 [compost metagenome]
MNQRRHRAPGLARLWRQTLVSEQEQVAALCGIQFESAREVVEKGRGHADVPPLLKPGVPRQTNPGQRGHLLAA